MVISAHLLVKQPFQDGDRTVEIYHESVKTADAKTFKYRILKLCSVNADEQGCLTVALSTPDSATDL